MAAVNIGISIMLFVASFIIIIYSAKSEKETLGIMHKLPVVSFSAVVFFIEFLIFLYTFALIKTTFTLTKLIITYFYLDKYWIL